MNKLKTKQVRSFEEWWNTLPEVIRKRQDGMMKEIPHTKSGKLHPSP
ncbi:MAG: hypothetical protein GWN01_03585 [Nitrosopumilaceae archaeon]|nr:hypothetical protein [Nitrosopumilaceae archaeon]NIU00040.1 hypothetical protein [Nitrosopumilaceae archaeon]NIU86419.1 hypothetical protein [Nitrosopumilaceae archaeon]NIV65128.1 hypothetical protein [Nitrosopumilaceae archaeon]NIX60642.1 hypothetical protein [Nitrosopumilaceae archaeon]